MCYNGYYHIIFIIFIGHQSRISRFRFRSNNSSCVPELNKLWFSEIKHKFCSIVLKLSRQYPKIIYKRTLYLVQTSEYIIYICSEQNECPRVWELLIPFVRHTQFAINLHGKTYFEDYQDKLILVLKSDVCKFWRSARPL